MGNFCFVGIFGRKKKGFIDPPTHPHPPSSRTKLKGGQSLGIFFEAGGGGVNHLNINMKREKPDPTHNNNNNNNKNNRATMREIQKICVLGSTRILRKVLSV